jgi:hypothetical protein
MDFASSEPQSFSVFWMANVNQLAVFRLQVRSNLFENLIA